MTIHVFRDEADGLWHWFCRSPRGFLNEHDAYVAAVIAHPDQEITVDKEVGE